MVHTATHTEGPHTASVHTHSEGPLKCSEGTCSERVHAARDHEARVTSTALTDRRRARATKAPGTSERSKTSILAARWGVYGRRGLERRVDQRKDRKRTRALCRRMTAADVTAAETGLAAKKTTTADTRRADKTSAAAEARRPWR